MAPPGPSEIATASFASGNSEILPLVEMRPIRASRWTNQTLPSGPRVRSMGPFEELPPIGNTVTWPLVVTRSIESVPVEATQRLPSAPTTSRLGSEPFGSRTWEIAPAVVILPIASACSSVNHNAPSGPATIP